MFFAVVKNMHMSQISGIRELHNLAIIIEYSSSHASNRGFFGIGYVFVM